MPARRVTREEDPEQAASCNAAGYDRMLRDNVDEIGRVDRRGSTRP